MSSLIKIITVPSQLHLFSDDLHRREGGPTIQQPVTHTRSQQLVNTVIQSIPEGQNFFLFKELFHSVMSQNRRKDNDNFCFMLLESATVIIQCTNLAVWIFWVHLILD